MTIEDEKLEEQIAAQEAGDAEAAARAADDNSGAEMDGGGHGYPPHVIEPHVVSDEEVQKAHEDEAREAAEGEPDQPEPQAEQPQPELNPSAMVLEGFDIRMFRLPNGEWIVGQFRLIQDESGNDGIAFYKVHRFAAGPHPQTGQPVVNFTPWPVERGTLELSEVTASGDLNAGLYGVNVGNVYLQFISPIQQANMQQAQAAGRQASAKKARAKRIMDAGGRF